MRTLALALVLCGSAAVAQDAEKVDNPEYQNWSKLKPGAHAKYKLAMTMNMGGSATMMEGTFTSKLAEVTPEKAVVDNTTQMSMGSMEMPAQTMKREVPAKVDKGQHQLPVKGKFEKKGEGEEEVAVGEKKLKTKWIEFVGDVEGEGPSPMKGKCSVKINHSDEVPGGAVKMEMKAEDGKWSMKYTLTEWGNE